MAKTVTTTPAPQSIVRTLVPLAVGQIASFFATLGIELSEDQQAAFTTILGLVVSVAYYLLVRWLEQRFPKVGILLGWAATPDGYTSAKEKREVVGHVVLDDDVSKH